MKLFRTTGKRVKTTLFAAKLACLDTVFMMTHNALPWLLTNSGLFEKNFANYQLGGPIDNLRNFFKMLSNLPDN